MAVADTRPLPRTLARRRLNGRALVGAGVAAMGVLVLGLLYRAHQPREVLVVRAVHDLPAGSVLRTSDVQAVAEALPDEVAATFVPASDQPDLVGQRVSQSLVAGKFLTRDQLGRSIRGVAAGQRIHTIPVSSDMVAGMNLAPGDQIEVAVTLDKTRPDAARTQVVVPRAAVYAVGPQDAASAPFGDAPRSTSSGPRTAWLALLVDDQQFQALAQAQAMGDLSLALLPAEESR